MLSIDQGVNMIYRFYANPVVTSSGTPLTVGNNNTNFSTKTAQGQAFVDPIVSSNGALLLPVQVRDTPVFFETQRRFILSPGNSLLLTIETGGNNKDYALTVGWVEKWT